MTFCSILHYTSKIAHPIKLMMDENVMIDERFLIFEGSLESFPFIFFDELNFNKVYAINKILIPIESKWRRRCISSIA